MTLPTHFPGLNVTVLRHLNGNTRTVCVVCFLANNQLPTGEPQCCSIDYFVVDMTPSSGEWQKRDEKKKRLALCRQHGSVVGAGLW